MIGRIKAFPVTGKIKEGVTILTPEGEVLKVTQINGTNVICADDKTYPLNVVILVKKYVVNRNKIAELHFQDYDLPLDKKIEVATKESLVNGFIGDHVRIFKVSADMLNSDEYLKIEPINGVIIDIGDNMYEVETIYGKRFKVRRHYFEILTRKNTKLVGKYIRDVDV